MSDSKLNIETFQAFFREVHGHAPYPWQVRMCQEVLQTGWRDFIQLPTGSGKTSVLDIAVFSLAAQADLPPAERTAATRIFFVIDRRIVVDEADRSARKMADHLQQSLFRSDDSASIQVALQLRKLADSDGRVMDEKNRCPLEVHSLRGGFYRTNQWAGSLVQPMIVTSTVDQVGSRMLFRGYGISPMARPLQAALTATDSLLILDEAHTATAMGETVETIRKYQLRQTADSTPIAKPMSIVQMTATLPARANRVAEDRIFRLCKKTDLADNESPLVTRYQTKKPVHLSVAKSAKGKKVLKQLAKDLSVRVQRHLEDGIGSIAIVVNRIATARALHELLNTKRFDIDLHLMIGRMRPIDRDQTARKLQGSLGTNSETENSKPIVVVSTQCLEVGADLDFDRMISEAASLDALRQRFGRLNRGGRAVDCQGEVVIRGDYDLTEAQLDKRIRSNDVDPVYGAALIRTFRWLQSIGDDDRVDFGGSAMDQQWDQLLALNTQVAKNLLIDEPETTTLLPSHVDLLSQTYQFFVPSDDAQSDRKHAITVHPDPDVGVFLHGRQSRETDVLICWRADLAEVKTVDGSKQFVTIDQRHLTATVSEAPPTSPECMAISIRTVKEFLSGQSLSLGDADQAFVADVKQEDDFIALGSRPVIWRGPDESVVCTNTSQIRPGDTLVMPVSAGGWSQLGHVPSNIPDPAVTRIDADNSEQIVSLLQVDVADQAALRSSWKPQVRLYPLQENAGLLPSGTIKRMRDRETSEESSSIGFQFVGELKRIANWLVDSGQTPQVGQHSVIISAKKRLVRRDVLKLTDRESVESANLDFDDANSASSDVPILLRDHLCRVRNRAKRLGETIGLGDLATTMGRAGELHDLGKADPRFQSVLFGGSTREAWLRRSLLAKSSRAARTQYDRRRDHQRAGLPTNFRHELLSFQLVDHLNLSNDPLLLHLIAAHHGHGRPWMPPCQDDDPPPVDLHSIGIEQVIDDRNEAVDALSRAAIASRFWRIQQQYGAWGTAYLESVLRIADQQISREESEGRHDQNDGPAFVIKAGSTSTKADAGGLCLTGIEADNPLGFLATLGLFRIINDAFEMPVQLYWDVHDGAWRPFLIGPEPINAQQIEKIACDHITTDIAAALNKFDELEPDAKGAGKITACPKRFHAVANELLGKYLIDPRQNRLDCDIAAALGNECSQKRSAKERVIEHSELYMTKGSGHQRMLDLMRVIREQTTWEHIEKTLFSPWAYDDVGRGRSLRWDPAEDRPYAHRWKNPSSDPAMTMLGANYLAIEALSFFPTALVGSRTGALSLQTTAFKRIVRETCFSWPVWTIPMTIDAVKSLLHSSENHFADPNDFRLSQHGVAIVKRVRRVRNDKYFNFSHVESV
ncbi:type I-U CRISPR-associated helicase/endonuclease Cas3 [Planctomycetes bacterium K23_9]|uniref:CRISPR-associated endonuclease/helicase Cas3 n=1 Tax=Stieleria marina TaxID=1930275 RepID=A0A517P2N7_9BACT|nr:CRISPR-associated endonuclease/helicase Cas3 [Planctomycetes bacterium K23_9]